MCAAQFSPSYRGPVLSLIPERHRHQRGSGLFGERGRAAHDPGGSPKNSTSIPLPVRSRSDSRATRPPADPPAGHAVPGDGSRSKPAAKARPARIPRSHRLTRMRRFLSRVGLGCRVVSGHRRVSRRPDRGGEAMSAGPQEFPRRYHAQDHGPALPPAQPDPPCRAAPAEA
jgi:hypothetical protein